MAASSIISPCPALGRHARRQAFSCGPCPKRVPRLQCKAAGEQACIPECASDRRTVIVAGIVAGFTSVWSAQAARAESACSDFATAANGIKWCETKEGSGKTPSKGQLIRCHYTGRLASNNQVFDSSYERRRPLTFKVGAREVIQGWDKAILGEDDLPPMKEGGKRRVVIPPELGYGARGAGGVIPPNATLAFDIELLGKR